MTSDSTRLSTGLHGLDSMLKGVLAGDNIVWQIDSMDDYEALVKPFCAHAVKSHVPIVYFRFASHPPLLDAASGARIVVCRPEDGFEEVIATIHASIEKAGRGAFFVFDCLSELAVKWDSDQMLANFFMLTCPYLFDLETVTYFALQRNYHSTDALNPIFDTCQLFLDTYRCQGQFYVRPIKVQHRYSSTINMLHVRSGDDFKPVTASAKIAEIMTLARWSDLHADQRPGFWERAFIEAQEVVDAGRHGQQIAGKAGASFDRLSRMVISRDEAMLKFAERYLVLEDILDVRRRMIGTGLIGGKAVGMLIARAIVKRTNKQLATRLEEHDSFFIGSDVFYTFLVKNGVWWSRQKQRDPETFLEGAERARRLILTGTFPEQTISMFGEMLDYFGQSPFIVRSSSLLEDNFGNAFAGKYDSVFCANQGPRERRLEDFLAAVRAIYASTMSEKALRYRARRGLLDKDEQMALLVMRVSGDMYGRKYYPPVAGVGFSFNPYAWHKDIDPKAGVLRLVFGLGTRAVDRSDEDYTRLVALNAPNRRPEQNFDEIKEHAQRRVDYIDLDANHLVSGYFADVLREHGDLPVSLFASPESMSESRGVSRALVLTFERLLSDTPFVKDMADLMRTLHDAYSHPVDIEFTANFRPDETYQINLLQCRPLQVRGVGVGQMPEPPACKDDYIVRAHGAVIGLSKVVQVDRFIYIAPDAYGAMPVNRRYEIARVIGRLNQAAAATPSLNVMLLGPGRWGTSSPELGIPVAFPDINRTSVLCEIVTMREGLIPDVSLGTHFLNELVEMDILYLALFIHEEGNYLDKAFFEKTPNKLKIISPDDAAWSDVVKVVDVAETGAGSRVTLAASAPDQRVSCYFERTNGQG